MLVILKKNSPNAKGGGMKSGKDSSPKTCVPPSRAGLSKEVTDRVKEIRKSVEKDSRLLSKFCLVDGGIAKNY